MYLYLYVIVIHMVYCPGRLHIVYILSITHITIINMYSKICIAVFFIICTDTVNIIAPYAAHHYLCPLIYAPSYSILIYQYIHCYGKRRSTTKQLFQYNIHTITIRHFYMKKNTKRVSNVMIICNSENSHTGGSIKYSAQPMCFNCLKAIFSHKQRNLEH